MYDYSRVHDNGGSCFFWSYRAGRRAQKLIREVMRLRGVELEAVNALFRVLEAEDHFLKPLRFARLDPVLLHDNRRRAAFQPSEHVRTSSLFCRGGTRGRQSLRPRRRVSVSRSRKARIPTIEVLIVVRDRRRVFRLVLERKR
jgi:hypothetical protein